MQSTARLASGPARARKKFLRYFPNGFRDETYLDWERGYKWETHERWEEALNRDQFRQLLQKRTARGNRGARGANGAAFASQHDLLVREDGAARCGENLPRAQKRLPKGSTIFCTAAATRSTASSAGVRRWRRFPAGKRACSRGRS